MGLDQEWAENFTKALAVLASFIYPESAAAASLSGMDPKEAYAIIPRATDLSGIIEPEIQAIWQYRHPLARNIIHELKNSRSAHAADCAGYALYMHLAEHLGELLLLIPIPLSRQRLNERGYNQCELIAKAALKYGNAFEMRNDILTKPVHRTEQKTKSRSERIRDSENIFSIRNTEDIARRICVIIDDVTTTGSTLAAARQAVIDAGAARVIAIAIAH
ncbi:MAG: competence protein competence protein ComFC [Candidatus Taylorbacteria bacterium]|nr:competence protein competence protein ComFC [Candidatus Taylorbacteria bacterium]